MPDQALVATVAVAERGPATAAERLAQRHLRTADVLDPAGRPQW
ncbi:hypothetical protein ACPYPG_04640 [Streptomyces sp. FR-108]